MRTDGGGMTLDDLWSDVRELSGKLSDVTRQAAYAGLAVIWIFKTGDAATYHLDRSLLWAGVLLALALALDLSQCAAIPPPRRGRRSTSSPWGGSRLLRSLRADACAYRPSARPAARAPCPGPG